MEFGFEPASNQLRSSWRNGIWLLGLETLTLACYDFVNLRQVYNVNHSCRFGVDKKKMPVFSEFTQSINLMQL